MNIKTKVDFTGYSKEAQIFLSACDELYYQKGIVDKASFLTEVFQKVPFRGDEIAKAFYYWCTLPRPCNEYRHTCRKESPIDLFDLFVKGRKQTVTLPGGKKRMCLPLFDWRLDLICLGAFVGDPFLRKPSLLLLPDSYFVLNACNELWLYSAGFSQMIAYTYYRDIDMEEALKL